ncbi:MAG: hypothetical protein MJ094_07145 [Saccharofermentans sp.]|nr:hypothetical protein [Saccharofermentans sp.]
MVKTQNKHKNTVLYIIVAVIMLVFLAVGLKYNYTRMTYLEFFNLTSSSEKTIVMESRESVLEQDFVAPFEMMSGISVKSGTFGRDNNSNWIFEILDKDRNVVHSETVNASQFANDSFSMIEFDKKVMVNRGDDYTLRIYSVDVEPGSIIQFWCDGDNTLNLKIFGSDIDYWWTGFFVFEWLVVLALVIRALYLNSQGKKLIEDSLVQFLLLGTIVFLLKSSFCVVDTFLDEYDNFVGGITVAEGGVIYREYITQHTPFLYYLCSIFALLDADSIEQFRLSYYALEAIAWGLVFLRNKNSIGLKKAFIIPIAETIIVSTIVGTMGAQVLSDNVQGLCFVALLLEFYDYYKTKVIDWKRSIIVSLCIWASFGSAFVSAFSLVWVVLGVVISEIVLVVKKDKTIKTTLTGFGKLVVATIIPPIIAGVYFQVNGCLFAAYEQAYVFNREIYPLYSGGYGTSIGSTFIDSIQVYVRQISGDILGLINGTVDLTVIMRLMIMILATSCIIMLIIKKKYMISLITMMFTLCSASRGYGFHGLAAYAVLVMLCIVFFEELDIKFINTPKGKIVAVFACILLCSNFVVFSIDNINKNQTAVTDLDPELIRLTDEGEAIFFDENLINPLYFLYKGRTVVNRQAYLLPWALDMFEQECIDDLLSNSPNIVVYNEYLSSWDVPYGQNRFVDLLKRDYQRVSDDPAAGWPFLVWIKK